MSEDANTYFLRLANLSRAESSYESKQGCAYLVSGLEDVKTVLAKGSAFVGHSHPFRSIQELLTPSGHVWLGMDVASAQSCVLMHQVQKFFYSDDSFNACRRLRITDTLSSEDFYFELKAMFFALSTKILFEYKLTNEAVEVARASNDIEDIRARFGLEPPPQHYTVLRSRAQTANNVLRKLAENIQHYHNHEPSSAFTHAIQETLLNAAVPLAYAFIWAILSLGRNKRIQKLVWREGLGIDISAPPSRNFLLGGTCCAVIQETLRLYPPVWALGRICAGSQSLGGEKIKTGEHVVISPYALHRMRSLWDRPNIFSPKRFEGNPTKGYAFIPFGAGAKICPAARWNLPILVMAVQSFIEKYAIHTSQWPHALPLVALRPSMNFAVSLQLRAK